jgi:O-antigen/teichoic acid export membrane protein|tara:strand:- start:2940 stop:4145 length:1206 start_codon:yes stop_codon:yes gene_type:complete
VELKNKLINLLNKHFSLLILGTASLSFFLTNIILKDYLSSENYGLYSIFITYISLLSSFGLLGFEQVIIRTASIFSDKIIISRKLLAPIIISLLLVSILGSSLFLNNYNLLVSHTFLFFITLLVVITKLFFNLFRLLSQFTFSQLVLNFWKFGLFIVLLILIFSRNIIILEDIIMIIFIFLIMSMFMVFVLYNKVQFRPILSSNKVFSQAGLFLLSLVTISLINFGDRFFIESRFGLQDLGDYFFFINLFLFPFTLFQSYVGFKEIVNFKLSYNQDLLAEKLKKIFKYSLIFGVFLFILSFLIDYFDVYHIKLIENSSMIILLIILGIVKMVYSLLSSAMGAICNNQMLFKINLYSIISILILCPFIYYYSTTITITILFLIVLWLIRCVIWYKQLLSFEN